MSRVWVSARALVALDAVRPRAKHGSMLARLGIQIVTALLVAGCVFGGISRDHGVELALEAGSDSAAPPTVVSAAAGPLGRFAGARSLHDERRDRQVWAVLPSGHPRGECVLNANGESVWPDNPGIRRRGAPEERSNTGPPNVSGGKRSHLTQRYCR